jgi:hypothetical protein
VLAGASLVAAAEPATCLSNDPSVWPAPSKPYFMVILDNSGSMSGAVGGAAPSCGYENTRIGHARCALQQTIQAFSGEVNFGLATYAWQLACPAGNYTCANCSGSGACYPNAGCTANYAPGDNSFCGPLTTDSNLNAALNASFPGTKQIHAGGFVAVPMLQDHYWVGPPAPTNVNAILGLLDNNCGNGEVGADSNTPLGGVLYNMNQYFAGTYKDPFTNAVAASPIGPATFNGLPAERPCRSINVILITDGDETCDGYNTGTYPNGEGLAVFEAGRLLAPGVTVSGQTFSVKTNVIGFIGANAGALNNIASAGGTGTALSANNETTLSTALAGIISKSIKPETCDNADNNCNGCTDEGFIHYCDVQPLPGNCCSLARATCLTQYQASITVANPKGNLALLPCTTVAQAQDPFNWLCYDPGEKCDNVDNNCELSKGVGTIDENVLKCGNPAHCPTAEVCNGLDDNCDGIVDNPGTCNCLVVPSAETCNGCDDNCNGIADDGVPSIPCGISGPGEPPNCQGTLTCTPQAVGQNGACVANGPKQVCNITPQPEICDNLDNDCNGIVDDGVPPTACVPLGTPAGLVYGGNSQCKKGTQACGSNQCIGFVGPSPEICDGIDNDCDGIVDDNVVGVGQMCGVNQAPCKPGLTACVNGALVCQGGVQPQPEVCDGIDNDCDGSVDEAPLADGPMQGQNGCWDLPGNCCQFKNLKWCTPAGAGCFDNGSLQPPCNHGSLSCSGGSWHCSASKDPVAEVCDGIDNDCDGNVDDNVPGVGGVCGSNVGECKQGVLACIAGALGCMGGVGPTQEICDGKDNDCDGNIDNGVPAGAPCMPTYDTVAYPGQRDKGACAPGIYQCNGMGGLICVGGVGPSPEVCDGIDNDCDGSVDEVGPAPDGIDGSDNPHPPPAGKIGDVCGVNQGECKAGQYECLNGVFACLGGQGSQPEQCDCKDNDCDGVIDNPNPMGPPICGMGKDCVKGMNGCQCAAPCMGEIPCPAGQICETVNNPQTGMPIGQYCTADLCGDCGKKTVKDGNGLIICAPKGTPADKNCITPPECTCHGQNGCQDPCFGVTCMPGQNCQEVGPNAGKCVDDNCWNIPCVGCDKACNKGGCVNNPCAAPNACPAGKECKPSDDFTTVICVDSCADVKCDAGKACKDGVCVPTCTPACKAGEVCDDSKSPPTCVMNMCPMGGCSDGSCCNPITGQCDQNCDCDGIICPMGQQCKAGQCTNAMGTGGGGGGSSTSTSTSTSTGSTTSSGAGGKEDKGIWGLATGGGGCACEASSNTSMLDGRLAFFVAALITAAGRRRQKRRDKKSAQAGEEVTR